MLPVPGTGSVAPLAVSPNAANTLTKPILERLQGQFPGGKVDPSTLQRIAGRAAQLYQTNRNAPAAIDQAIQEAQPATDGAREPGIFSAWNPFDWGGSAGTVEVSPALSAADPRPPATARPTDIVNDVGSALLWPVGALSDFLHPHTHAESQATPHGAVPETGNVPPIGRDPQTGGYYTIRNGQRVPLYQGQTATSASTGKRIIFVDGRWYPIAD
jgi:hypothetical protein